MRATWLVLRARLWLFSSGPSRLGNCWTQARFPSGLNAAHTASPLSSPAEAGLAALAFRSLDTGAWLRSTELGVCTLIHSLAYSLEGTAWGRGRVVTVARPDSKG